MRPLLAGPVTLLVLAAGGQAQTALDLNALYQAAAPCQTITVPAGAHPAQVLKRDPDKDGAGCRVVFKAEPGAKLAGFTSGRAGGSGTVRGADHFELVGFEVGGQLKLVLTEDVVLRDISGGSFAITSSRNVSVVGGEFGPWVDGVNHINRCGNPECYGPTDILLDRVVLHDFLISNPKPHSECLMIWGAGSTRVTIRNSIFRNCTDFGLLVKAPGATGVVVEDSFFDAPMPGDRATTACNPGCPRAGNSIRFSGVANTYAGSAVRGNIVNGGIAVDCKCVPVTDNAPGTIPVAPPPPLAPLLAPALTLASFTRDTVTVAWQPVVGAGGYRFYRDGVLVASTNDPARSTVEFGVAWGRHLLAVEAFRGAESARGEVTVEGRWLEVGS